MILTQYPSMNDRIPLDDCVHNAIGHYVQAIPFLSGRGQWRLERDSLEFSTAKRSYALSQNMLWQGKMKLLDSVEKCMQAVIEPTSLGILGIRRLKSAFTNRQAICYNGCVHDQTHVRENWFLQIKTHYKLRRDSHGRMPVAVSHWPYGTLK